jgi:hypothetical protein
MYLGNIVKVIINVQLFSSFFIEKYFSWTISQYSSVKRMSDWDLCCVCVCVCARVNVCVCVCVCVCVRV